MSCVPVKLGGGRFGGNNEESRWGTGIAHAGAGPLREGFPRRGRIRSQGQDAPRAKISATGSVADSERIRVRRVGAPEPQQLAQGQWGIGRRRPAKLVNRVDAVAIRARPDFAGTERNPITLLYHAVVVVSPRKLPRHDAVGRDDGRLRAVAHHFRAAGRSVGFAARVIDVCCRVHRRGEDAASRLGTVRAVGIAAQIISARIADA